MELVGTVLLTVYGLVGFITLGVAVRLTPAARRKELLAGDAGDDGPPPVSSTMLLGAFWVAALVALWPIVTAIFVGWHLASPRNRLLARLMRRAPSRSEPPTSSS